MACEAFGYIGDISEIYEGDCRIELKKGNKCAIKLDGDSFDGKYTLEGEALNITIQGTNSPGTLKDGVLCIDFMEIGANLYFVKEGVETPDYLLPGGSSGSDSGSDAPSAEGAIVYQGAEAVYLRSELVKDYNDADTIAVYFDFTHNNEGKDSFGWSYYYTFKQGDVELESTSVFPNNATTELAEDVYTDIASGEHIEICLTYILNDTTTPVTITFTNLMDDLLGELTIDPSELGAPAQATERDSVSYSLYEMEMDGDIATYEELLDMGYVDTTYAILNSDGTGSICFDGELMDLTYDDDTFYSPAGDTLSYYIDGDFLIVDNSETIFTFLLDGAPQPASAAAAEIPAEFIGDWHGMAVIFEGTGIYAENVDLGMEIISRFTVDAQPFIALALGEGSADNFADLGMSYDAEIETMFLTGTLLGDALLPESIAYVIDGELFIDVFVDDGEGNSINIYACLKALDEEWDEDDYPALPQDAVDFYRGMTLEEIAELFGLDPASLPAKS